MSTKTALGQAVLDAINSGDPNAVYDAVCACNEGKDMDDEPDGDEGSGSKGPAALVLDIGPGKKAK